jgi:site-specific recombinase XerD
VAVTGYCDKLCLKKLERLRAFMRFAEKRKWIDDNPAIELKAPKVPFKKKDW